jgi:hypothetical protein
MDEINKIRRKVFENQQTNDCNILINKIFNTDNIFLFNNIFKENIISIYNIISDIKKDDFTEKLNIYLIENSKTKEEYLIYLVELFEKDKINCCYIKDIIKTNLIDYFLLENFNLANFYNKSTEIDIIINDNYIKKRLLIERILTFIESNNLETSFTLIHIIRVNKILLVLKNQPILIKEFEEKFLKTLDLNKYIMPENKPLLITMINLLRYIYPSIDIDIDYNIESTEDLDRIFAEKINLE